MPLRSQVHVDKLLTNLLNGAENEEYVADAVMPAIFGKQSSGKIARIDDSHYRLDFASRAPGGPGHKVEWGADSILFNSEEYRLEHPIDDTEKGNFDDPFDAMIQATMVLRAKIWAKKEDLVATVVTTQGNYPAGNFSTPGTKWDVSATADPVKDVGVAKKAIISKSGVAEVHLHGVTSYEVFEALRRVAAVRANYTGTTAGAANVSVLSKEAVASALGLASIQVGSAVKITSNEGLATDVFADIWPDKFAVYYKPATAGIMIPGFGYQYFPSHPGFAGAQVAVDTYRDESITSDVVRAKIHTDQVVVRGKMGYLLEDLIT